MSANLSKTDLLTIFEEIKQEQATQFQLSDRFIKKLFTPRVLEKAKQYLLSGQINWLEHSRDFSVIDASILTNTGSTYTQHIEITKLPTGYSVDSHCSCNAKTKCRHIAAVLLKLKVEHSGSYGEDYFINDWLRELSSIKQQQNSDAQQVLLFVLDIEQGKLILTPKVANKSSNHNYTLGRNLTDQQLNSFVTPANLLETDFRLYTWIRSQNTIGSLTLQGQWGFDALQQLIATQRLFFQRSREPIKAHNTQALTFSWQHNKKLTSLNMQLDEAKQWVLIHTTPPTYFDYENLKIGRIRTPLSSNEISHLKAMPSLHDTNFDRIYKQLADNFGPELIPHPHNKQLTNSSKSPVILNVSSTQGTILLKVLFNYSNQSFELGTAPAELINTALENTVANELVNIGFEQCKAPLQNEFLFNKQTGAYNHWFNNEIIPQLKDHGWQVNILQPISNHVVKPVELELKRGKGHQVVGKIMIQKNVGSGVFNNDNNFYHSLNRQSELFYYFPQGHGFTVITKRAFYLLQQFKDQFEFIKTRSEFIFPVSYLQELLSFEAINSYFTDDKLKRYFNELTEQKHQTRTITQYGLKSDVQLREYQQQGIAWLSFLKRHQLGGILADDMGLGKTLQVIAFLADQVQFQQAGPSLIVCPTTLVGNWQSEINRFSDNLKVTTIFGAARVEQLQQLAHANCIITTYPLLKRDIAYYSPLYFENIILDEAQYIKNEAAQVSRLVKRLNADFKLCLSGTPIENNLFELKSLLDFAMPNLLGTPSHFKQHFQVPIEKQHNSEKAAQLKTLILPFILRRTKAQVVKELPQKTELIKEFEFTVKQQKMYSEIAQSLEKKLVNLFTEQGVNKSKLAFLEALLKLRQVCCHPKLVDSQSSADSAKLEWLSSHLPRMLSTDKKVIIFSQFTKALALIAERLKAQEIDFSLLTGQTRHRDKVISEFTSGQTSIFLISLKAGGTGLNLTQADTVIHFDPWWNPAVENQATDRAYRIGQTNPVFVYKLMMNNSIEQKVFKMQQNKQALADVLFTDKVMNFNDFNEEQMLSLLKG